MERIYHYFWKYRISRGEPLPLCNGGELYVIDPGQHNTDSGPDFTNAKIRIDGESWAGNVEIHVRASDWKRHGHETDAAYDSIILHAVGVDDFRIIRKTTGEEIAQYLIHVPREAFQAFAHLTDEQISEMRCGEKLPELPPLIKTDWIQTMGMERLQEKARRVMDLVTESHGDWQQACFILLARGLGFGLNADPFEMLARSLPLNFLARHSDSSMQLEALIFGQAGMLDMSQNIFDEYYQQLCREYYFLSKKYGLRPIKREMWKFSKTRPQNFPHRRLAMLAAACQGGFNLFSKLIAVDGPQEKSDLQNIFSWNPTNYWHTHTSFDSVGGVGYDKLSESSLNLLAINVIAPILYAYGSLRGNDRMTDNAMLLLESIPPENNSYIRHWKSLGITPRNAFETQALLHLRKSFCDNHKCLYCRFGHHLIRRTVVASRCGGLCR